MLPRECEERGRLPRCHLITVDEQAEATWGRKGSAYGESD